MQQKIDKSTYLVWLENPCTIKLFKEILPERIAQVKDAMADCALLEHPNMVAKWAQLLGKKLILQEIRDYGGYVFVNKKEENQNGA